MGFNRKNTGIITQVRMTSTRLPGKVLRTIKNKPLLQYHIERLQKTGLEIIIATTNNETDDCIIEFAEKNSIKIYRGSEKNVLSRYYEAALKFNINIVIRVTSDCPLIDPGLISDSVKKYIQFNNQNLYMSNGIDRRFARGFDFEIFSFNSLKDAYLNAKDESDLEHVTPYIWKNKSGKIEYYNVMQPQNNSKLRITVDTPEDFELINQLIEKYHAEDLSYSEIESILKQHPELTALNANITQKEI